MPFSNDDFQAELIKDFILESLDGLDRYDRELLALEQGRAGQDALHDCFRVVHSIKGTAGCLGLAEIERASHQGEDLMSLLRDGQIEPSPDRISTLLKLSDAIRALLAHLEQTGSEGVLQNPELLQQLETLAGQPALAPASSASEPAPHARSEAQAFGLFADDDDSAPAGKPDGHASDDDGAFGFFVDPGPEAAPPSPKPAETPAKETNAKRSIADSAIRVDVSHLDKVMNIVGELVLARNQILLNTATFDRDALLTASQRLNIITTELQESVMKTRMQPIRNVWSKFPRIVRDLAADLGKQVKLVMDGQDTELDRTIIEAIKDPLTHVIRNAIDHGIEAPEQRRALDKPEEGLLSLRAFHEGGQVNIEVMDDGSGINADAVLAKAVAKGIVSQNEAERLAPREIINLIFQPGFSTAATVSNVSGRGVGMDVVKTNIERIGGSVDLLSEPGQGSTIRIKIPLTLAIIPALLVACGGDRYAIPQVNLLELVRLDPEKTSERIERLHDSPVYRLRGRLLPIVFLHEQLEVPPRQTDEVTNIVVLQADDQQFGLVVDQILDTEEIVVKPLGKQLKRIACFAGATILGDGKVALIIDGLGLAQRAQVVSAARDRARQTQDESHEIASPLQTLLLFEIGAGRRMALPLSEAARLEEFPPGSVERSGRQSVIQYRGQILPLVQLADALPGSGQPQPVGPQDKLQVIVYSKNECAVGLVVGSIIDIVETEFAPQQSSRERGVLGSAVIQGRVTDFLDAPAILEALLPQPARN